MVPVACAGVGCLGCREYWFHPWGLGFVGSSFYGERHLGKDGKGIGGDHFVVAMVAILKIVSIILLGWRWPTHR